MTKSILLADCDPISVSRVTEHLSAKRYKVFSAASGRQVIDLLHNNLIDAMILDPASMAMPPLHFLQKLRLMQFRAPCIIVCNDSYTKAALAGLQLGVWKQFAKPVDLNLLSGEVLDLVAPTPAKKTLTRTADKK